MVKVCVRSLICYLEPKARDMKYPNGSGTVLFDHHAYRNKNRPGEPRATILNDEFFLYFSENTPQPSERGLCSTIRITPTNFSLIFPVCFTLLTIELEQIS